MQCFGSNDTLNAGGLQTHITFSQGYMFHKIQLLPELLTACLLSAFTIGFLPVNQHRTVLPRLDAINRMIFGAVSNYRFYS